MLKTLNDRLAQYAGIHALPLDNGLPMALNFSVNAADPAPAAVPRTYAMSPQPAVTRPQDLEDIAFLPVTQLAELLRTRQISSLELTEMYLARLKRYDPVSPVRRLPDRGPGLRRKRKRADDEIARGTLSRSAARRALGRQGPAGHAWRSHRLGRHALQGPDHRS